MIFAAFSASTLLRAAPAAALGRFESGQQRIAHALKLTQLPLQMVQIRPHGPSLTENGETALANSQGSENSAVERPTE